MTAVYTRYVSTYVCAFAVYKEFHKVFLRRLLYVCTYNIRNGPKKKKHDCFVIRFKTLGRRSGAVNVTVGIII